MKEELDFTQAPYRYALCLNRQCPKADTCLRQMLVNKAPVELEFWMIVSPKYQASLTGDCPFYRSSNRVRYAQGFIKALNNQPHNTMVYVSHCLMAHFGRRTYYRIRKGERLLSPKEQQYIQDVFKEYGGKTPIEFDAYQEGYNW